MNTAPLEKHIVKLALSPALRDRVRLAVSCGPTRAEAVVRLSELHEALEPMHEPTMSWLEARTRLAHTLAELYSEVADLPLLLEHAGAQPGLLVLHADPARAWASALERLDRGSGGLRQLLRMLVGAHPDCDPLVEVFDVLEGGWQALDALCTLVELECVPSYVAHLEVDMEPPLDLPRMRALERLMRTPP